MQEVQFVETPVQFLQGVVQLVHCPLITRPMEQVRQLVDVPGNWQVKHDESQLSQVLLAVFGQFPSGHDEMQLDPKRYDPEGQERHVIAFVMQVLQTMLQFWQVVPDI